MRYGQNVSPFMLIKNNITSYFIFQMEVINLFIDWKITLNWFGSNPTVRFKKKKIAVQVSPQNYKVNITNCSNPSWEITVITE